MEHRSFDQKNFRKTLGQYATGVTIITTNDDDLGPIGVTANSFTSVSMAPPLILWSLAKSAYSLRAFQQSGHFNVHILAADQEDISNHFAVQGADKFDCVSYDLDDNKVPLIDDCSARLRCKTMYQYEGGDHIIFVGEVVGYDNQETDPLVFHNGQYASIPADNIPCK